MSWRTNKLTINKVQTFVNKCLRWILDIKWFNKVTDVELCRRSQQEPVSDIIRRRKWRWLGYTLGKPVTDTTRQALGWNPAGKRRRKRPKKKTWKVEDEAMKAGKSWPEITKIATKRYVGGHSLTAYAHHWAMDISKYCTVVYFTLL